TSASLVIGSLLASRAVELDELVHPSGMPAARELRLQPGLENLDRGVASGDPRPQRQDVRVVVLATHPRRVGVTACRGPDTGNLVPRHRHPDSSYTYEDAAVGLAGGHRAPHRGCVVGVVDGLGRLGPEVDDVVAAGDQPCLEVLLQGKAGVVRARTDDSHS